MSARYKYVVAAVAGVALLGGAVAYTYFNQTGSETASAGFEQVAPEETGTTTEVASTDTPATPVVDGNTDLSAPEAAPETGLTPETGVTAETAAPASMDETSAEIVIEPAPADDTVAEPVTSETQPE